MTPEYRKIMELRAQADAAELRAQADGLQAQAEELRVQAEKLHPAPKKALKVKTQVQPETQTVPVPGELTAAVKIGGAEDVGSVPSHAADVNEVDDQA
ncbi:hypothetical protein FOA52_009811 [Chlamydomonas sp. UWO 241]|nr:hypothetical protein FOA52_009811 [Chlamydomonas sp. UWO 241]